MRLSVDPADPTPPYEQLRRQLLDLVGTGALAPGDRLPPLRQLAGDLGLAVGTVARTYRELEAAGVLTSRRGGGTRVTDQARRLPEAARRARVRELAATYLAHARALGASDDEIRAALD
ncbi:GntR family transcriptional regulator [Nocardioides anomalus]|uniref:GntR family transcriptional regulator n=1 Tax=Nocardioides anomalus TaxID=2712223 RepID=A0A6G6WCP2_9ACTN|nr:GntR family transcriptional regulator [Nocardioides anomalus]QIG43012.1 GntR family transcriptional regulator [Nocardioides anomalus]